MNRKTEKGKKRKSTEVRENYWREKYEMQLIEMDEKDNTDLEDTFNNVGGDHVPPDMKYMWEQQLKNNKCSSSKIYRWHPNKATARRRRGELFKAARIIHGVTNSNKEPAELGLLDAVTTNCTVKNAEIMFSKSKKIKNTVFPRIHKRSVKKYEKSTRNMIKSVANYYGGGVSGKIKYMSNRKTGAYELGGDGAPFGKYDVACSWLVSFLNIGRGVLSSNENFLLFGANCTENSVPVKGFLKKLYAEIIEIENSSYTVTVNNSPVVVKFYFSELPNDMKMLTFLAGELPNSANCFSTFANVNYDDYKCSSGSFSLVSSSAKWHPWDFQHRKDVAKEVEAFKVKQEKSKKKLAPKTLRLQITTYIANRNSRQEFSPPIRKLIDRAHVEPLHLKNNACAHAHKLLLNEVLHISLLPPSIQSFSMVPQYSPFHKYIMCLGGSCQLSRLSDCSLV
ncbi:hypothetical protein AC249_AIPGENE19556 [Exaiptasia diaphana]|nr:hypothetical protein AC249_AIPGENE19556 [Exaiptasia diaphana]